MATYDHNGLPLPASEQVPTENDLATETRRDLLIAFGVAATGCFGLSVALAWMSLPQFLEFAVSHISVGAFIAGLVGIAYELRAPSRHLRIANRNLRLELRRLVAVEDAFATKELRPLLEAMILINPADATHIEIVNSIETLVKSIQHLDAVHWVNNAISATTISVLLKYASDAAKTLAQTDTGGKYTLSLPVSAEHVADKILAHQTLAMSDGDSYSVVSDLSTWIHGRLPEFWKATKQVVNTRDVTIRRAFARFPHDKRVTRRQVSHLLRRHLALSAGRPHLSKTLKHPFRAQHNWEAYQLGVLTDPSVATHVGVFKYGNGATMCFEPQHGGLSEIQISVVQSDPFDVFWHQAIKSLDGEVRRDFEAFDQEIRRYAPHWWDAFERSVRVLKGVIERHKRGNRSSRGR